ncbi:MAG: hypothetical protein IKH30_20185 [Clostridia bacterium]|nr:hypothetical protein [Clostridia bacterium]
MAYCVHCGVKLGDGEKRCPLCLTPVFDPSEPQKPTAPRAYPVRTPEQELKRNKRFLLFLAGLMLAAPALLCLMIDLLLTGKITWSGYASSALILLFAAVAVPLLADRRQVYVTVGASFLCLNGYLFLVERLSDSGTWFFPIALPAISLFAVMLTVIILLYRRQTLNKLTLIASSFAAIALECFSIEWLIAAANGIPGVYYWSPFVLAPCIFISLALFFINRNRAVREEVRRRVHF